MPEYLVHIEGGDVDEGETTSLDMLPDSCPFCHASVVPTIVYGYVFSYELQVFFACPNADCQNTFIGYYDYNFNSLRQTYRYRLSEGNLKGKSFPESIVNASPHFSNLYNEAYIAEQHGLKEICGVGYRKALEFLIKDYAIKNHPEQKANIQKIQLAGVIGSYVTDERIKSVAKRAAWLGNDETHYIRKWEGKNLQDLKKLIELTVHWIEMEILTASFEEDMPD